MLYKGAVLDVYVVVVVEEAGGADRHGDLASSPLDMWEIMRNKLQSAAAMHKLKPAFTTMVLLLDNVGFVVA